MIVLPFPPATLSGHNTGHWRNKRADVKSFREQAWAETLKAKPAIPSDGDIHLHITFVPPDNRGDRTNFPNRCKPIFDGIADALEVNDKRFVPHFEFAPASKPGWVAIEVRS